MEAIIGLFMFTVILALIVGWIYLIVEIVQHDYPGQQDKIVYLVIVLLLPLIGSIIYLCVGRSKRLKPGEDLV